jgi:hypothetical protein
MDRQRALLGDAESDLPRIAASYLPIFVEAVLRIGGDSLSSPRRRSWGAAHLVARRGRMAG